MPSHLRLLFTDLFSQGGSITIKSKRLAPEGETGRFSNCSGSLHWGLVCCKHWESKPQRSYNNQLFLCIFFPIFVHFVWVVFLLHIQFLKILLHSHLTKGCILSKSESRKAVFGGMTYSCPIRLTTRAWSELFSVTRENKSTCEVEPSPVTSGWEPNASSSSSSTRGSSLAISQKAAKPHSRAGSGSSAASVCPSRCPSDRAASTKDSVPFRITLLHCTCNTRP